MWTSEEKSKWRFWYEHTSKWLDIQCALIFKQGLSCCSVIYEVSGFHLQFPAVKTAFSLALPLESRERIHQRAAFGSASLTAVHPNSTKQSCSWSGGLAPCLPVSAQLVKECPMGRSLSSSKNLSNPLALRQAEVGGDRGKEEVTWLLCCTKTHFYMF